MEDLTQSLLNFLEEQDEKAFVPQIADNEMTEDEIAERFKITSKDQANYYVRKVKELELEEAEIEAMAQHQLERLQENIRLWKEKELKKLQYPKQFFIGLLETFAEEQLQDAKKKTLSLPNGSIGFKKQRDEYHYDDKLLTEFLSHSKYAHEETVIKINKTDLKKDLSVVDGKAYLEGTLVPGIEVTEKEPKFEVK